MIRTLRDRGGSCLIRIFLDYRRLCRRLSMVVMALIAPNSDTLATLWQVAFDRDCHRTHGGHQPLHRRCER